MITLTQFIQNYTRMTGPHDVRSKAIVESYNTARKLVKEAGGNFERTARDINVITMLNEKTRYFTDDELIEMTTKEN